ncbi:hypothetical protein CHLRE_06g302000v5 [Chlamydomonas reinhardtii]|uniref:Uncharacterized protein n=1 Tax=Chlamydomonas reinhardtii TaxID=3055 RepID=A0A2K3DR06_CHLRE|nr:uncharacterized protein CHLRE_06g302000v5 [Chlamydomonas reinhardtii]PNW82981.1 hypothetical protein CHLRE_06g302000v5 [Chlamydomonas reinhardtii]
MTARVTSLKDYPACLCNNLTYFCIWLADCVIKGGNWFTFISAYSVIAQLRPNDAATHTALFLICRRVPYLLLFPVTGLAADRLNRGALLVAVCLVEGAVSFTLPLVQQQQNIWLLYPLIFCQYCAQAFYDPARTATLPSVVPRPLLHVAGTLDFLGYSLMALTAASAAGRTAAVYGPILCFRVEGVAFGLAALLLMRLALHGAGTKKPGGRQHPRSRAVNSGAGPGGSTGSKGAGSWDAEPPPELQPLLEEGEADVEILGLAAGRRVESASLGLLEEVEEPAGCGGCGALAYLSQRQNWDVAMTVWVKATGAMVWGAADVLNGRFSAQSCMQSLGGPDQTLGFILAAVGVGCVVGPLFVNSITPGVARCWRISIAAAFGLLAAGYAVMAAASSIMWILPASSIRTAGSTIIYIHSFAILQHRLHEGIRGRVFAVEFVLFTISEASSSLAAGWALDGLGWSTHRLSATIACVATGFMAMWGLQAWLMWGWNSGAADEHSEHSASHRPHQRDEGHGGGAAVAKPPESAGGGGDEHLPQGQEVSRA